MLTIMILGSVAGMLFLVSPLLFAAATPAPAMPETPRDSQGRPQWAVIPPATSDEGCTCGKGFVPPF